MSGACLSSHALKTVKIAPKKLPWQHFFPNLVENVPVKLFYTDLHIFSFGYIDDSYTARS